MITDGVIYLRAPEPTDVAAMFRWENDRTVWRHGRYRAPISMQALSDYVASYSADIVAAEEARFVVCDCASDRPLGCVDLYDYDAINRRCGVGIIVDEASRRKSVARRAIELLADYLGRDLGIHQMWAIVSVDNEASTNLFEKSGFKIAGRLKSWIRINATSYADAFVMQRLLV